MAVDAYFSFLSTVPSPGEPTETTCGPLNCRLLAEDALRMKAIQLLNQESLTGEQGARALLTASKIVRSNDEENSFTLDLILPDAADGGTFRCLKATFLSNSKSKSLLLKNISQEFQAVTN